MTDYLWIYWWVMTAIVCILNFIVAYRAGQIIKSSQSLRENNKTFQVWSRELKEEIMALRIERLKLIDEVRELEQVKSELKKM